MVTYSTRWLSQKEPAKGKLSRQGGPEKAPRRNEDSRLASELADEWCRQGEEFNPGTTEVMP